MPTGGLTVDVGANPVDPELSSVEFVGSVESLGAPTTMVGLFDPITPAARPAAAMIAPVAKAVRIAVRRGFASVVRVASF